MSIKDQDLLELIVTVDKLSAAKSGLRKDPLDRVKWCMWEEAISELEALIGDNEVDIIISLVGYVRQLKRSTEIQPILSVSRCCLEGGNKCKCSLIGLNTGAFTLATSVLSIADESGVQSAIKALNELRVDCPCEQILQSIRETLAQEIEL